METKDSEPSHGDDEKDRDVRIELLGCEVHPDQCPVEEELNLKIEFRLSGGDLEGAHWQIKVN
jgi:hypothetical protein